MNIQVIAHAATVDGRCSNSAQSVLNCVTSAIGWVEVDVNAVGPDLVLAHEANGSIHAEHADKALALAGQLDSLWIDLKNSRSARVAAEKVREIGALNIVFTSNRASDLRTVRTILPTVFTSLSYPRDYRIKNYNPRLQVVLDAYLVAAKAFLPIWIAWSLHRRGSTYLTLHHRTITRLAIRMAAARQRAVFAWTVDYEERAVALVAIGVAGIITNRPLAISSRIGPALSAPNVTQGLSDPPRNLPRQMRRTRT